MQASSNVVFMRDFAPDVLPADSYRIIKECRERSLDRLSTSLSAMLDKVEETLWGMAEQSDDRESRDAYYKAKDGFRELKVPIAQQFRLSFMSAFENKSKGVTVNPVEPAIEEDGGLQLTLVEDDDLTESLKFGELANRLRGQCEAELISLEQRFAILLGVPSLGDADNPLGPVVVCESFKNACGEMKSGFKVRMVLLKLFEEHVLPDVRTLYHDTNTLLIDHGILPKLRPGARRKTVGGTGPVTGPRAAGPHGTPLSGSGPAGVGAHSDAPHGEQDFFSMLQGLLSMNVSTAGLDTGALAHAESAALPGAPAAATMTGAELIGSLTRMQRGDNSFGGSPVFNAAMLSSGAGNILRELKSTALGGGFGQVDTMTLDIVALLFDQIFDDRNIPSALKALIGRLQIPVLKVAVLDKKFFSKKNHPARRLLDVLGDFGLGLGEDFNPSAPLYVRLDGIVQRLLDDFDDNVDIFEKMLEELQVVITEESKRAEEEAGKSAKRIADTERLAIARVLAQNEIKQRAEEKRLPQAIQDFLASHWMKLLLLTYARGGKESAAWKSALETMDVLIWSVEAKQTGDERRRLAAVLPGLLKRLDAGMKIATTAQAERDQFFGRLMRCHTKVIEGSMPVSIPVAKPAVHAPAPTPAAPATAVSEEAVPKPSAPVTAHPVDAAIDEKLDQWNDDPLPIPQLDSVVQDIEAVELAEVSEPASEADTADDREAGKRLLSAFSDADIAPATSPPVFDKVVIRNPFGAGEIEVEEVDFGGALPAAAPVSTGADQPMPLVPGAAASGPQSNVAGLKEGAWVEIRREDDSKVQARLAYVSPMRNTYLFTNRQGTKVAELSLYELAREVRSGNINVIEEVALFDRAMGSLVGTLRKNAPAH